VVGAAAGLWKIRAARFANYYGGSMMKSLKVGAAERVANEGVKWRREEPLLRERALHGEDAAGAAISA
jgi:hypothetical protein